jgi:hypothetical protein
VSTLLPTESPAGIDEAEPLCVNSKVKSKELARPQKYFIQEFDRDVILTRCIYNEKYFFL